MEIGFDTVAREFFIRYRGQLTHTAQLGKDAGGIIQRIDNCLLGKISAKPLDKSK